MARRNSQHKVALWEKASEVLEQLPEKPKSEISINTKDGLSRIKSSIFKAQKSGYTYEEIVKSLQEVGINISLTTFKSYFVALNADSKRGKKALKSTEKKHSPTIPKEGKNTKLKSSTSSDFHDDDNV